MGRTGLGKISDPRSHKVWDRICTEGTYTAMNCFQFDLHHASSRDATAGSQELPLSGLGDFDFTWSETHSCGRQRRACHSWRGNGERVMFTYKLQVVSRKVLVNSDASFHLRYFAILAANHVILLSGSNTDLEAACNHVGDIFCHTWRERGQVGGRSVLMRQVSQRVRAARRHASASD